MGIDRVDTAIAINSTFVQNPLFAGRPREISLLTFLFFSLILAFAAQPARASVSDSDTGRRLIVDYTMHMAHHVEWPLEVFVGTNAPFRICMMGQDFLGEALADRLKFHRVRQRKVELQYLAADDHRGARKCQILLVGERSPDGVAELARDLDFFPVLTISDMPKFANYGGMVGFVEQGSMVSLQFNKAQIRNADLKYSSSIARLAKSN